MSRQSLHIVLPLRRLLAAALCAAALGGCVTASPGPVAGRSGGATIAFETIDGPPPQVFDRLVRNLNREAQSRNLPVVSREAPATYRVRGYLSAQVRRGQTLIAWVWDVYDAAQERTLRLSGEETSGKAGRDAWATASDAVLTRIAQATMNGITGLADGTLPATPASPDNAPPARSGPAMVGHDPLASPATLAFAGQN
jgi:hypothetical protein